MVVRWAALEVLGDCVVGCLLQVGAKRDPEAAASTPNRATVLRG